MRFLQLSFLLSVIALACSAAPLGSSPSTPLLKRAPIVGGIWNRVKAPFVTSPALQTFGTQLKHMALWSAPFYVFAPIMTGSQALGCLNWKSSLRATGEWDASRDSMEAVSGECVPPEAKPVPA